MIPMNSILKLPACERCRIRKIKCDSKAPKCTSCDKAQSACILVDAVSRERHTRQAIFELEEKLKHLEANSQPEIGDVHSDDGREHPFIGPGSELEFLKYLFATADWVNAQADLLRYLSVRAPLPRATVPMHDLPTLGFTQSILDDYFLCPHVHHPYLARRDIDEAVQRIYHRTAEATRQDYYRIFMVLALGSIAKHRKKQIEEYPYGFFKAAQQYVPLSQIGTVEGIQNILMRARFAGHCHVKSSIWDMSHFCMRQCIELGLHRRTKKPLEPFVEQMQRRTFWTCYVQDRYSSGVLGRPYAISDSDIDQPLPILADDEEILASDAEHLDDIVPAARAEPRDLAVFIFVIRLRQVCSEVQKAFFSPFSRRDCRHVHQISDAGHIYSDARKLLTKLSDIQNQAPIYSTHNCLYKHPDWHALFVVKDKLFLLRGAMSRMSLSGLHPARDLLQGCLNCATMTIRLYIKLRDQHFVTWTRSYFQIIFTAGLSIIFSLSTMKRNRTPMDTVEVKDGIAALPQCGVILREFVEEMPDATRFALVFDVLWKKCLIKLNIKIDQYIATDVREPQGMEPRNQSNSMDQPTQMVADNPRLPSEPSHVSRHRAQTSVEVSDELDSFIASCRPNPPVQTQSNSSETAFQLETPKDSGLAEGGTLDYSQWPLFDEGLLEQMEAGVGEFTWGNPLTESSLWQDLF